MWQVLGKRHNLGKEIINFYKYYYNHNLGVRDATF